MEWTEADQLSAMERAGWSRVPATEEVWYTPRGHRLTADQLAYHLANEGVGWRDRMEVTLLHRGRDTEWEVYDGNGYLVSYASLYRMLVEAGYQHDAPLGWRYQFGNVIYSRSEAMAYLRSKGWRPADRTSLSGPLKPPASRWYSEVDCAAYEVRLAKYRDCPIGVALWQRRIDRGVPLVQCDEWLSLYAAGRITAVDEGRDIEPGDDLLQGMADMARDLEADEFRRMLQ